MKRTNEARHPVRTSVGMPVVVFPGFGVGDLSTIAIRRVLGSSGYRPHRWCLGVNLGDLRSLVPKAVARTEELSDRYGKRVGIVGWSLGGVIARDVARHRPGVVRGVVTLGSPAVGGPRSTAFAPFYEHVLKMDLNKIERATAERNRRPIRVPVTSIYSRRDRVVDWEACIDPVNEHVRHVEVDVGHLALGFNPKILRLVAQELDEIPELKGCRPGEVSGL